MFGIFATIIAAEKGHKTFAWIVGIWTGVAAIAFFVSKSGVFVGPGLLFLIIAICMKKEGIKISQVLYCPNCGRIISSYSTEQLFCSECNTELVKTALTSKNWSEKTSEQRQSLINMWGIENARDFTDGNKPVVDPNRKFICKNCGTEFPGWNQICPSCKSKGTIVKNENGIKIAEQAKDIYQKPNKAIPSPSVKNEHIEEFASNSRICKQCGAYIESDSSFCNQCGAKIEEDKDICPSCGHKLMENAKYCQFCGVRIKAHSE